MRLTESQVKTILSVAAAELKTRPFEVFLYGSRVNDSLRGGDIDLYFLSENEWAVEDQKNIFRLMAALKSPSALGDRKMNLSLISKAEQATDPFWKGLTQIQSLGFCK